MDGFSPAQAIIAAMITPALLILASGSLIATALVRLARVVDRMRRLVETKAVGSDADQLARHKARALCAERAVKRLFYAVVCFVLAGFAIGIDHFAAKTLTFLPIACTSLGMALIVAGCAEMLAECRLATEQILSEIAVFERA